MSISAADIKSASFGSDVTELEELTLTNKGIHDLGVIHTVPRLTTLNLAFNCLASLSGLHVLQRLVSLNVSHNALTSLSAVSQLPSLASLNASNNKVASIAGLSACGSLRDLFVQGNLLSSVGELRVLSGLTSLQRLCLHPSPATKKADPPSYRAAIAALCSGLKVLDAAPVSDSERAACGLKDSEDFFDAFVAACSGPGLEGLLSGGYSSGSAAKPPPHGPLSSHSAPSSLSGGGSPSRGGGVNSGRLSFGQSGSLPNRRGVGRFAGLSPPPTHSALSSTSLRLLRETATLADLAAASPRGTDEDGGGAGGDGGGGGDDASSVVSGISMRSGSSMVSGGSDKRPGRRRTGGSSHSLFTAGSMPLPKPVPENAGFADVLSCLPTFEGKFSALKLGDHGGVASTMEALDNGLTEWLQSKLKEGTSPPTPSSASPAKLAAASTGLRHSDDDF